MTHHYRHESGEPDACTDLACVEVAFSAGCPVALACAPLRLAVLVDDSGRLDTFGGVLSGASWLRSIALGAFAVRLADVLRPGPPEV